MIEIVKNIHPVILDTAIVSIFVLIIFFGIIKGLKKTLIDFFVLALSIFMGFSSIMNSVKSVFAADVLNAGGWLPAGSANSYKVAIVLFSNFFASLAVFLLFYVVFHVLIILINIFIRRKSGVKPSRKSKVGRVVAGLLSLIYQGTIFVVLLLCFNNKFIGLNDSIKETTVTKYIVGTSEKVSSKISENATSKLFIKFVKGDLFYKVDNEVLDSFKYIENKANMIFNNQSYIEKLEDVKYTNDETNELINERFIDLAYISFFINGIDDFGACKKDFSKFGEEKINMMHKVSSIRELPKIEMNINTYGNIKNNLKKAGINEKVVALCDEFIEGK